MSSFFPAFPAHRARRNRRHGFSRSLVRETHLQASDLILPVFIVEDDGDTRPIAAMPGVKRHPVSQLEALAVQCWTAGIQAIALFPVIDPALKGPDGQAALDPNGLLIRATRMLKAAYPHLGIISDVALDPYTSHGQDGLIDSRGNVLNDPTVAILARQAVLHAAAGVDIVAPSDMMDGRIGAIRAALDHESHTDTQILAYSAKYASRYYGPFREAVGSAQALGGADKASYQMDPANSDEAVRKAALDVQEGADIIMVKPGLPYLDIIWRLKNELRMPTFAYQVSGEYAQIKAAGQLGWLDEKAAALESLLCLKRAGADAILSYFALDAAGWLNAQANVHAG